MKVPGLAQTAQICDYRTKMPDEAGSGGGFPGEPNLAARVIVLESAAGDIRAELKAIRAELTSLRLDVAEIKGRLTNIPTTFQFVYMQAGFVLAIFAAAFALLRFAAPH
jgi:hypothetical protein